jgi:hypothetical protein
MSADADSVLQRRERVRKPTWRKVLPWALGGAVLLAVLIFAGIKLSNTGESTATPLSTVAADDRSKVPKSIKLDPAARRVAGRFIQTAVARKHLDEAYALVGPAIKQGQTLKEWKTGNIAVVPYPVDALQFAPMKVDYSYPREAQIQVALLPTDKAEKDGVKPQLFIATLIKNTQGKWLVNAWVPRSSPPVPSANPAGG